MVKNILIYIYLLLTVSCVRPNIQSDIIPIDSVSPSIDVTTTDEEPTVDDLVEGEQL